MFKASRISCERCRIVCICSLIEVTGRLGCSPNPRSLERVFRCLSLNQLALRAGSEARPRLLGGNHFSFGGMTNPQFRTWSKPRYLQCKPLAGNDRT